MDRRNREDRKRKGPLHSLLSGSPGSSLSNLTQDSEHEHKKRIIMPIGPSPVRAAISCLSVSTPLLRSLDIIDLLVIGGRS